METKRLLLRNFTLNDIDACYQCWGQDQTLGRYILNYPMTDRQLKIGELGYIIGEKYQKQGYVSEAARFLNKDS